MATIEEEFVGDGLYISFDGEQYCLRAPRAREDHVVYFDSLVFKNIVDYIERQHLQTLDWNAVKRAIRNKQEM